MLKAPIPVDDEKRVAILHALNILDTIPEERFDRVTRLAQKLLNVPIVLVSLVDRDRQWFKSRQGLDAPETPRDVSFCGHAIMGEDMLYVPDATRDERFADNPLVTGGPRVTFYAGQPLTHSSGAKLGTLCAIDSKPREFDEEQKQALRDLAVLAENELNIATLSQAVLVQKESEARVREVLDHVNEGLFVVYPDFCVGPRYSAALPQILNADAISGIPLPDIIGDRIDAERRRSLADYLEMMFRPSVQERMLNSLNPLRNVVYGPPDKPRYLDFRFSRVMHEGAVAHLVVVAEDRTQQTLAEIALKEAEARSQSLIEKLFGLLHVDPRLLRDFLEGAELELSAIASALEEAGQPETYASRIERIFRAVHTIKGDAALLGVELIVKKTHAFEEQLTALRNRADLTWSDFVPVGFEFAALKETFTEIRGLVERLTRFQTAFQDAPAGAELLAGALARLGARLAQRGGKQVEFISANFQSEDAPERHRKLIKDVLVQFVRNSVDHGIEEPAERLRLGKPAAGRIEIAARRIGDELEVTYRDDGRGFAVDRIREIARQAPQFKNEAVDQWEVSRLIGLIFLPGFSTAEQITESSGRGVGMDIVKKRIRSAGGKLAVRFAAGSYVEFVFTLPL